jgi:hypothetical protein
MHEHKGIEYWRSFLADAGGQAYAMHSLMCPGCLEQVSLSSLVDTEVMTAVIASADRQGADYTVTLTDGVVLPVERDSYVRLSLSDYEGRRVHLALHQGKVVGVHPI